MAGVGCPGVSRPVSPHRSSPGPEEERWHRPPTRSSTTSISLILLFGAAFTRICVRERGGVIRPRSIAVPVRPEILDHEKEEEDLRAEA